MTTLHYAHLCEMAFLSQNGNLNIIGIFENVNATQFPTVFPKLAIIVALSTNVGKHQTVIRFINSSTKQEVMNPITIGLDVKDTGNPIRLIGDINNLNIKEEGAHLIRVEFDGNPLVELPFTVKKTPKPIPQNR